MTDHLGERVARLEAVLPEIRDDLRELRELVARRMDEHEQRLGALERWRAYLLGMAAVVGAIGGAVIAWLGR